MQKKNAIYSADFASDALSSHNGAVENYKTSKADPENSERGWPGHFSTC